MYAFHIATFEDAVRKRCEQMLQAAPEEIAPCFWKTGTPWTLDACIEHARRRLLTMSEEKARKTFQTKGWVATHCPHYLSAMTLIVQQGLYVKKYDQGSLFSEASGHLSTAIQHVDLRTKKWGEVIFGKERYQLSLEVSSPSHLHKDQAGIGAQIMDAWGGDAAGQGARPREAQGVPLVMPSQTMRYAMMNDTVLTEAYQQDPNRPPLINPPQRPVVLYCSRGMEDPRSSYMQEFHTDIQVLPMFLDYLANLFHLGANGLFQPLTVQALWPLTPGGCAIAHLGATFTVVPQNAYDSLCQATFLPLNPRTTSCAFFGGDFVHGGCRYEGGFPRGHTYVTASYHLLRGGGGNVHHTNRLMRSMGTLRPVHSLVLRQYEQQYNVTFLGGKHSLVTLGGGTEQDRIYAVQMFLHREGRRLGMRRTGTPVRADTLFIGPLCVHDVLRRFQVSTRPDRIRIEALLRQEAFQQLPLQKMAQTLRVQEASIRDLVAQREKDLHQRKELETRLQSALHVQASSPSEVSRVPCQYGCGKHLHPKGTGPHYRSCPKKPRLS